MLSLPRVYINGPAHMTKMVATPIYGTNLKKIFFGPMIMKLDELSGLIRVQIVRHSDGIPERFFFQKVTVKKQQTVKKHE